MVSNVPFGIDAANGLSGWIETGIGGSPTALVTVILVPHTTKKPLHTLTTRYQSSSLGVVVRFRHDRVPSPYVPSSAGSPGELLGSREAACHSHPSAGDPFALKNPETQPVITSLPPEHAQKACIVPGAGMAFPTEPQCSGLVKRLTSQPSAGLLFTLAQPVTQDVTATTPATHA